MNRIGAFIKDVQGGRLPLLGCPSLQNGERSSPLLETARARHLVMASGMDG